MGKWGFKPSSGDAQGLPPLLGHQRFSQEGKDPPEQPARQSEVQARGAKTLPQPQRGPGPAHSGCQQDLGRSGGSWGSLQAASPVACDAPGSEYGPGGTWGMRVAAGPDGAVVLGREHSGPGAARGPRGQGSRARKNWIILSSLVGFSFLPSSSWSPTNPSVTVPTELRGGDGERDDGGGWAWAGLVASPKDRALLGLDPHGARLGTEGSPLHSHPVGTASSRLGCIAWDAPGLLPASSHRRASPWAGSGGNLLPSRGWGSLENLSAPCHHLRVPKASPAPCPGHCPQVSSTEAGGGGGGALSELMLAFWSPKL
ncbi:collagen alpha-2(I) chain-like [Falco cherrug]|uniref:collagen alpha-2(I) chain-like n=1 Tax=Falco cherrug TaxID=345164 RepID=UPI0024797712|nr:collagen alpha-2(I) chain-like [Falco cherrug]